MGLISKASIIAASDLKSIEIEVPEWGGSVRLHQMSAAGIMQFWDSCRDKDGNIIRTVIQPNLLKQSIVDEGGKQMFSDEDIEMLMGKSPTAINLLFSEAQKLNGMGAEDDAVKK